MSAPNAPAPAPRIKGRATDKVISRTDSTARVVRTRLNADASHAAFDLVEAYGVAGARRWALALVDELDALPRPTAEQVRSLAGVPALADALNDAVDGEAERLRRVIERRIVNAVSLLVGQVRP